LPRARPSSESDIQARERAFRNDALTKGAFADLARPAKIPQELRTACLAEINDAFRFYTIGALADLQEHPARQSAALKLIQHTATKLVKQLAALTPALRQELGALNLDGFAARVATRAIHWRAAVEATSQRVRVVHRRQWLYQDIEFAAQKFSPDHLRANERIRRKWVCDILRTLNVAVPNEQKNRAKVTGKVAVKRGRSGSEHVADAIAATTKRSLQPKRADALARQRRLSKLKI
jgi:hypothetical protein